jgi:hypothetical protein
MDIDRRAREAASEIVEGERFEQFRVDAQDFLSARELGEAVSTRIEGRSAALVDAAEIVNRSFPERDQVGHFTNVISPVVMPNRRFSLWPPLIGLIALFGLVVSLVVTGLSGGGLGAALFGPHFWLLLLAFAIFGRWRRSVVMVPDGCQALITRFGKLEGKQRIDTLLMEIERAKKERDARLIEVKAARNKARQDVARMLEEQETEAQRVRLEIETRGRTTLVQAENEATAPGTGRRWRALCPLHARPRPAPATTCC